MLRSKHVIYLERKDSAPKQIRLPSVIMPVSIARTYMAIKFRRIIYVSLAGLILIGIVDHNSFSYAWTTRPVLFVGLGDSVTAGFGARKGYSYFDRLVKNPADEFPDMNGICLSAVFPKIQSTNLAISGSTSSVQFSTTI